MSEESKEITLEEPLVPLEKYLEAGVHIGSRFRSGDMRKFIYKCRNDGLCVLDVTTLNNRIKTVANFLSTYEPAEILVVAGRTYAQKPAHKFAEFIGAKMVTGRFVPGTLTNPDKEGFIEPKIIFAADPPVDRQVIREAIKAKLPVVSLADTSNSLKNIDLVIPSNNKGKKSLSLIYWLLTREILKKRGIIKSDKEFTTPVEDFESTVAPEVKERPEKPFEKKPIVRGRKKR